MEVAQGLTVKFRGRTYPVSSLDDAADKWCEFRDAAMREGFGPDDVGSGLYVMAGQKKVGRVFWNGRAKAL